MAFRVLGRRIVTSSSSLVSMRRAAAVPIFSNGIRAVAASRRVQKGRMQLHSATTTIGRGRTRTTTWCSPLLQQRRTMFIQTESTPNPNGIKFVPTGKEVLPPEFGSSMDFRTLAQAQKSPLARKLFAVQGVKGVFFGSDFITVTKEDEVDVDWDVLKLDIFSVIMDYYATGAPIMSDDAEMVEDNLAIQDDDSEIVAMIKELLETRIRPAVQEDGGDILYRGFDEATGLVSLQMAGSCADCPSSTVTLRHGVENMLMHYIPEVNGVHQVESDSEDTHLTFGN